MSDDELSQRVADAEADGWTLDDRTEHRAVLVRRSLGSRRGHVVMLVLFVVVSLVLDSFLIGLGNAAYAYYSYVPGADRRILRSEQPDGEP